MHRILVIEDDPATRNMLADYLGEHGLRVHTAGTASEARRLAAGDGIDLAVLDLGLPDQDGMDLARELSGQIGLPVVILTGRSHEADRVLGLELGADDYLTKPFSPRELLARIRAVLRRAQAGRGERRNAQLRGYRFAGWELRTGTRRLVSPDGKAVTLTSGEFSLLLAFLKAPRQVLSRDRLLEATRLYDDVYDRSIDVQILRLRRKIERDPAAPGLIRTERGAGYCFDCEVEPV
jgi:DNA-binding response OmpR family regulator